MTDTVSIIKVDVLYLYCHNKTNDADKTNNTLAVQLSTKIRVHMCRSPMLLSSREIRMHVDLCQIRYSSIAVKKGMD